MSSSGPNWLVLCVIFAVVLAGYLAVWLLLLKNTKRIARAVVGILGSLGLAFLLYITTEISIYGYLSQKSNQVSLHAVNRKQVQLALRHFKETPIPLTPNLALNLGIKDKTGLTMYRYSFPDMLNSDNCIDVLYDSSGEIIMVIEVFE